MLEKGINMRSAHPSLSNRTRLLPNPPCAPPFLRVRLLKSQLKSELRPSLGIFDASSFTIDSNSRKVLKRFALAIFQDGVRKAFPELGCVGTQLKAGIAAQNGLSNLCVFSSIESSATSRVGR